ncbi:MAG TPA: hypothetical protein VEC12_03665, partial [Bacteroidia bacterium]|nr:hypothetical protein [Bacteroidia bacterium]
FDLPVKDSYKPRLSKSFLIYEMDENFKHHKGFYPYAEIKQRVLDKWGDTIKVRPGKYTFAAWGEDFINDATDGVHLNYVDVLEESEPMFSMALQRFAFDESRKVNCHVDYCQYKEGRKWHKCFTDDGNTLGFYTDRERRVVNIGHGQTRSMAIVASDLAGFTDSINFILLGDSTQEHFMSKSRNFKAKETFAYPGKAFTHTDKNYIFTIPKGALYDTIAVNTKYTPAKTKTLNAGYVTIMDADIPLDKAFTVSIKPAITKGMDTDKLLVVRLTGRNLGYKISEGGTYKNGYVTAISKTFGVFSVAYDNVKPSITRFRQKGDVVAVSISDALSGIDKYNAYINGDWFLMEYDAKDDLLWGTLPAELSAGQHELKIIVSDEKGNTNTFVQKVSK